jgi:proline iminopeptidase
MQNNQFISLIAIAFVLSVFTIACNNAPTNNNYFTNTEEGIQTGGIKVISINTPKGKFKVWTKRMGNNPTIKVLLLNGGPGGVHDGFECFENFFPKESIEFIYYDQLACGYSDNPKDTSLYDLPRYVEEVEQVRKSLNLDKTNFYLLGHSWGGILAMQYALKYQDNLKGLIISNMMASCPEYGKYADNVLAKQMPPAVLDSIRLLEKNKDFQNPKYMEILMKHFYSKHVLRLPESEWPEPFNRGKWNNELYVIMQGPSEFGIAGKLANWDVSKELKNIKVPSLVIGATYDTMDPKYMEWMSKELSKGEFLLCPNGSHICFYDDQQNYFTGLIKFIKKVDGQ